jgi:beta-galactosidase
VDATALTVPFIPGQRRLRLPLALVCLAGLFTLSSAADTTSLAPRERLLFDLNWRFHFGDPPDAGTQFDFPERLDLAKTQKTYLDEEAKLALTRVDPVATNLGGSVSWVQASFNDEDWGKLNLPHDWFIDLPFKKGKTAQGSRDMDPAQGTNIGWYRRSFELPAADAGKHLTLEMDGVLRNSLVWLNGHCLGRHLSGYTGFAYDLTPYAVIGGKNELVVRADASRSSGWFYEGAGIYRHVWLVKTNPIHVAHWGTYVASALDANGNATLSIETTIRNDGKTANPARLVSTVLDASGQTVAEATEDADNLSVDGTWIAHQKLAVTQPKLWSPETPVMYTLISHVMVNGQAVDTYRTPFGIRTLSFDANQGFFLNGKRYEVDGTCNHQDHAGLGVALPDRVQYFRVEKLKELGSNADRTSHNAPTPELLDACDQLGLLVMDENRNVGTTPGILGELRDTILRDRNHPSVFIWSLGNEENAVEGDDTMGVDIANGMQKVAHDLDPTRLCTAAVNGGWGRGFSRVLDVMGYNYFNDKDVDKYHRDFPDRPSISTEDTSVTSTRGVYQSDSHGLAAYDDHLGKVQTAQDKAKGKPPHNTYRASVEDSIKFYADRPFVAGFFAWTGFDYRGEPSPFGWPHISSSYGTLDTCGFMKDNAYLYQAWWGTKPMLHIFPHWNWAGQEGKPIRVWAESNCDEVELFLNGQSLGRQTMPKYGHLEWRVPYAPGTLSAEGYQKGKKILEEKVETTGAPVAIRLVPDRTALHGDGEDVSLVTVEAVDDHGRTVPTTDNLVHFHVDGGTIIGVGNGDAECLEADHGDQRSLYNGLAQVIVQTPPRAGKMTLTANSPGLSAATVTLDADGSGPRPFVP